MDKDKIEVLGARVHNLKNIDVVIPRNSLTVFTGLSGSGKSSLAFDTIYAEGQRRYIETFSAYARNFLGNMERPDVFDFFLRIVNRLTGSEHEMRNIPLPIGISFFTFGAISYLMDLYRGHYEAEKNPLNMALYLSFFPKISVGPIARYRDFAPQLTNRQETVEKTAEGIRRFAYGLGKKVLVANIVGASVDKIYAQDITNVTGVMVWCAAILYAIQIYYDFSGFTDMAIGLGKMFGFDICENFNYPYLSGSIQEFWRRWHISLSSWFRDYLYIPLGGNRKGKARTYLNLAIVFFATGLWHGATTAFIAWGALHGFFIIVERIGFKKILDKIGFLRYVYTGLVVLFGWVIFRVANLHAAYHDLDDLAVLRRHDAVQLQRYGRPLVFLDAAVVVGLEEGQLVVLVERGLLEVSKEHLLIRL